MAGGDVVGIKILRSVCGSAASPTCFDRGGIRSGAAKARRWQRATELPLRKTDLVQVGFCAIASACRYLPHVQMFEAKTPVDRDGSNIIGSSIKHPPCGPWGRLSWRSREDSYWGVLACDLVERYGGIVEQPLGSRLFRGRSIGPVVRVRQGLFGHAAEKWTLLYVVASPGVRGGL